MDDLTFSARRASAAAAAPAEPADLDARFRTLVQSPLRAGILRYLSSRPDESFDVEALMQTFGRLRLDVENCVRELATSASRRFPGSTRRATSPSGRRTTRSSSCSTRSSSAAPRSAPRISRRRSSGSAR